MLELFATKYIAKWRGILNTPKFGEEAQNLVVRKWGSITPWWTKMF
jgi:hypothetical protein